jgi:trigger factor
VNVTVENLAPCKKLLRVEVDVQTVDTAFDNITREFQREARLPGFRPGKAPRDLVLKTFSGRIEDEVKRKLISDHYSKALKEQKLRPVIYPEIEEIQFGRGQTLQFAATVETEPDFELPEYVGLPAKRENTVVTDADLERALNVLREQRGDYKDLARAVEANDFVVINYIGTSEGRPITEIAPTARGLAEQKNYWVHVQPGQFIPGFTEQLIGAVGGDKRTVTVDFPADFVSQPLAGKKGVYDVEIVQVKERSLPELNDEFAKSFGAPDLEKLREGVKTDLQNELNHKQGRAVRDQLVRELMGRVTCDLPESIVTNETRNVVYNIVHENQQRGVAKDIIEKQKDEIFSIASNSAKDRVKAMFVLSRIAEKEGIKVEQAEVSRRVLAMSQQYQMPVQKLVKQLEERNGFGEIQEQIMTAKVLDFLELHAKIEETPAGAAV